MTTFPAARAHRLRHSRAGRLTRAGVRRATLRIAPDLGTVFRVDTDQPVFALTFDDGPDPHYTPSLLDVLDRHGARATFFMLGQQAQKHPDLVGAVAGAGHAVASHGWDHTSLLRLAPRIDSVEAQVRRAELAIGPRGVRLFRPPYGHLNLAARRALRHAGLQIIGWDVDPRDWQPQTPVEIATRVELGTRPGSIVLLHDRLEDADDLASFDREPTVAAVDELLGRLDGKLRSVTVPLLLAAGKPRRRLTISSPAAAPRLRNPGWGDEVDGDAQAP